MPSETTMTILIIIAIAVFCIGYLTLDHEDDDK